MAVELSERLLGVRLAEHLATKTRAARTCSGTAGIITLWRNSAADIKDTDPS